MYTCRLHNSRLFMTCMHFVHRWMCGWGMRKWRLFWLTCATFNFLNKTMELIAKLSERERERVCVCVCEGERREGVKKSWRKGGREEDREGWGQRERERVKRDRKKGRDWDEANVACIMCIFEGNETKNHHQTRASWIFTPWPLGFINQCQRINHSKYPDTQNQQL